MSRPQQQTATGLCCECELSRQDLASLCQLSWDALIDVYEFMIALTAFRRNVTFYANMTDGQLRSFYCQLVSYSPAKVVALNALSVKYSAADNSRLADDAYVTPSELIAVVSLSLGNAIPRYFVEGCLNPCSWRSYEHMILTCFSATESVRSSVLRYTAIMRAHAEHGAPHGFRVLVATAVTGWMGDLEARDCTCGTWRHVVHVLSCSAEDTETSLTLQDAPRAGAYICELLEVNPTIRHQAYDAPASYAAIDYAYVFNGLIVPGLCTEDKLTTN